MNNIPEITRTAALRYNALGLGVVPVDSNKAAICKWDYLQVKNAEPEHVARMFDNGHYGVAILTGPVSGELEVVDVDVKYDLTGQLWRDLAGEIREQDPELFKTLTIARTTNNVYHIFIKSPKAEGNKKLASRPATDGELAASPHVREKVLIETRGRGGYIVAPPTPGYEFIQGGPDSVPSVTQRRRDMIFAIARSLDLMPRDWDEPKAVRKAFPTSRREVSPGQDYNAKADAIGLLLNRGWNVVSERGERVHLKRPGGSNKTSANYHRGLKRLYVFSGSTEFEPDKPYSPVEIYAVLEHGGDFKAAYGTLREQGFGSTVEAVTEPAIEGWHNTPPTPSS